MKGLSLVRVVHDSRSFQEDLGRFLHNNFDCLSIHVRVGILLSDFILALVPCHRGSFYFRLSLRLLHVAPVDLTQFDVGFTPLPDL